MTQQEEVKLPEGWINTTIGEVCNKPIQRKPEDDESFHYIDIGSVNRSAKTIEGASEIIGKDAPSRARKTVDEGDIIVSMTRPNLNAVAKVQAELSGQIASTGFDVLKPILIEPDWVFATVKSERFIQAVSGITQGALYPACKAADIRNFEFGLPPLPEQKRIVEKLDGLLAQVDTIQQRLNSLPDIIKRFRQSVLAAAVSGNLTEKWRQNNSVSDVEESLILIGDERAKKVTARTKVPQEHLKDEEYPIPEKWKWVSLDSLAAKIVDGVHHKPVYTEVGIPFMSVKDIQNGNMTFDFCKYISEETHREIHPRCNPEKGDLLITKSGTIGRTAIVKTEEVFDLFVSVALIKPASSNVNINFIDIALRKWVNSIDISSRVVGTAIKNLHLRDMRVLAIPFAPLQEQTEIVRLVEQYFALADTLEKNLANAKQRVDNLTQSILAKAFKGELVPQDPNDEPADKLLERIKAARLETEKLEKAAKKAAKASAKKAVK